MRDMCEVGVEERKVLGSCYVVLRRSISRFCLGSLIFFYWYGDHRELHRVDRRQRQICIIDSITFVVNSVVRKTQTGNLVLCRCFLLINTEYHAVPVSYTHLRAHETVLELVCRLLIEKKTKNTTIWTHTSSNFTPHHFINNTSYSLLY